MIYQFNLRSSRFEHWIHQGLSTQSDMAEVHTISIYDLGHLLNLSAKDGYSYDYNYEDSSDYFHSHTGSSALFLLFSIAAMLCNSIVLGAFCRMRSTLTSHDIFIVSLSVADMLVGIGTLVQLTLLKFSTGVCDVLINSYFHSGAFVCSILSIALMSVDHYISIVLSVQYGKLMSRGRAIICVITVWAISVIISTMRMFSALKATLTNDHVKFCNALIHDELTISHLADSCVLYSAVILAILIVIFAYVCIYIFLNKVQVISNDTNPDIRHMKKRAMMTTLWIIGTFVLLWIPQTVVDIFIIIVTASGPSYVFSNRFWEFYQYFMVLPLINSLCDPVIYAIRLPKIREALRCCRTRNMEDIELSAVTRL